MPQDGRRGNDGVKSPPHARGKSKVRNLALFN